MKACSLRSLPETQKKKNVFAITWGFKGQWFNNAVNVEVIIPMYSEESS